MKHNGNVSVVENRVETEGTSQQQQQQQQQQPAQQKPGSDVTISVVNKQGDNGRSGSGGAGLDWRGSGARGGGRWNPEANACFLLIM